MIMAYWGGMTWEVSSQEIAFLESLSTGYSINADNNEKELQQMSFSTTYRIETGTPNIRNVISQWENKVGKVAPIIIGSAVFGPQNMQLQTVDVSNVTLSAKGQMRSASLTFKFQEYRSSSTSSSSATKVQFLESLKTKNTALSIGATTTEKSEKKTVTANKNGSTITISR